MGIISRTVGAAVDITTFPLSYPNKVVTGKTFGDYVTGNQRPPSQAGMWKSMGAAAVDIGIPVAIGMVFPPAGIAAAAVVVGTKAITGNSIGDYVVGDTNASRQEAENTRIDNEYAQAQERAAARGQSPSLMQQSAVSAPSVGAQQGQMQGQAR